MIGLKVLGKGNPFSTIAFIGEGPGEQEAIRGEPFVGASGAEFNNLLRRCVGIRREEVYVSNIVKWRTDENDRDPTDDEIERDKSELYEELRRVCPQIIVAIGRVSARFFLGKSVKMEFIHGMVYNPTDIVAKDLGAVIFPVYHPAAGIRLPDRYGKHIWDDFTRLGQYLKGQLEPTPVDTVSPQYTEVEYIQVSADKTAIDTEGWIDDPYSIQLCQQEGIATVVPYTTKIATNPLPPVIGHNIVHDLPIMRAVGIDTRNLDLHDTMIQSYLLGLYPKGLKALAYRLTGMKWSSYPALVHTAEIKNVDKYLAAAWFTRKCVVCSGQGKFTKTSTKKVADPNCMVCAGTGKIPKLGKKGQLLKTLTECECVTLQNVFLKAEVKCPACTDGATWPPPPKIYDEEGKLKKPWSISRRLKKMMAAIDKPLSDLESEDETTGEDEDEADHPLRKTWNNIDPEIRKPVEDAIGPLPRTTLRDVEDHQAVIHYSASDADATLRCHNKLSPKIKQMGLERVYDIDRGILPMLDRMQTTGMLIDRDYFAGFQTELEGELVVLQDKLSELVGYSINPGSSDQVASLLYGKLELPPPKFSKKTSKPSTDAKSMEALKIQYAFDETLAPIIDAILDYREHAKMLGTYVLPIQRLADRNSRIHTQLLYTNTTSGRLASRNINLQNIPTRSNLGKRVRNGFIAQQGCVLLSVDLDQIELRVGAHLSNEPNMIRIFQTGEDIHRATAALIYGLPPNEINPDQRRAAKTTNFGIFYGMSPTRLMNELALLGIKISKYEASAFIEAWFKAYPGVKGYMADCHAEARTYGYVRTMFGRIRYLPAVWSTLEGVREEALRQAGNTPIQGTAGEILKIGMRNIDRQLPAIQKIGYAEPLVPVHDELIFEVEESMAPLLQSMVEYEMSHATTLSVPLGAKGKTAHNWGEFK
jgi:uracil-DNA glycosylase family 4